MTASPPPTRPRWLAPLVLAASIVAIGFVIGWSTGPGTGDWFRTLNRPAFQPPDWAFPVAWTILYIAMGVAGGLIVNRPRTPERRIALVAFAVQLVFNFAWSPVFFGAHAITGGLVIVACLLLSLLVTTLLFAGQDRLAGVLMVPYLAWVAFATLLNASIAVLN